MLIGTLSDHYNGRDNRGQKLASYARQQTQRVGAVDAVRRTFVAPVDFLPGYMLLDVIAHGAQGIVYEAIQQSTKRRVAVKIFYRAVGQGVRSQVRFEREIEVLGQLRHPNIVTVHDGGATESGHFYIVLDCIDGLPIDQYLAERDSSVGDILRLFVKVCHAVNSAHLRGAVHRDLKPSNILVDANGEPHVLDFGLAKLVDGDAKGARLTGATMTGEFVGTLHWASPEQVEGALERIDIRTDVYALGILLYYAITDTLPYGAGESLPMLLHSISHAEPARPSEFRRDMEDDVDTIVLKCLNKDRDGRYQSAGDLARDIERYLNKEPIDAKRDSTWYLITRMARRHRRATLVVGGLAVVSMIYATSVTMLYRRALVAETEAHVSTRNANQQFENARTAYETLLDELTKQERIAGTAPSRRVLSDVAYKGLSKLIAQDTGDRPVSADFAASLCRLGEFASELGRNDEALAHFRRAAEIREVLVHERVNDLILQANLSINLVREGDVTKESGDIAGAQAFYERALAIDERLVQLAPNDTHLLDNLAWSYQRLAFLARDRGDSELAESRFRKQLTVARRAVELEPNNATRLDTLLDAELRQVQLFQSPLFSLNNAKIRLMAAQWRLLCDPSDALARSALLAAEETSERARVQSQRVAQVMKPWVATIQQVAESAMGDPNIARRLIERLRDYAYCAHQAGFYDDSTEAGEAALTLATKLVQRDPGVIENLRLLAGVHSWELDRACEEGDFATALLHAQSSARCIQRAMQETPQNPKLLHEAFLIQHSEGSVLLRLNQEREAHETVRAAIIAAENALNSGLMSPEFMMDYGKILTEPESFDNRDIDRGLDLMEKAIEKLRPSDPLLLDQLGNSAFEAGRRETACAVYRRENSW